MNIERFHLLSTPQQYYYTKKRGVYLSIRQEKEFSVHLYEVMGYYVEIYCKTGNDACLFTRSFQSTLFLEPYLKNIDVNALFKC